MTIDVQREYERMVQIFENPNFSEDDNAAIAEKARRGTWLGSNSGPALDGLAC